MNKNLIKLRYFFNKIHYYEFILGNYFYEYNVVKCVLNITA